LDLTSIYLNSNSFELVQVLKLLVVLSKCPGGGAQTYLSSLWQIDRHFSSFLVTDMTIEKLQKVATAHVDSHFKAKWLRWWNSPPDVKNKKRFPSDLPLREKVLDI